MTTRFRLDALTVDTTQGDLSYHFPSALTVLAGSVGAGKSTLFELIKYALGGNALLAPVVVNSVRDIAARITVGDARYSLIRSIDPAKKQTVRVTDLITGERLVDHYLDARQPSLNALLLDELGLPADMRAAARTKTTTNAGARISFADIFSFMYISQADINRDIASSQESYREPKRKAVFELLFGITDSEILQMRSDLALGNGELEQAVRDHDVVLQFLRDSNTASRTEALAAQDEAIRIESAAAAEMDALRRAVSPVVDRETQTLRDLLGEAERNLADARSAAARLAQQQSDYSSERRRVMQDLARLRRLQDAGDRLASIEFMVCPRCMQDIHNRHAPQDLCRLCLQPDPVGPNPAAAEVDNYEQREVDNYEQRQLVEQLAEMDDQLLGGADQLAATNEAIAHRQTLVEQLSADLEKRTRDRITPQLQAFTDATRRLAEAQSRQHELEGVLRQWDRADDLGATAEQLRGNLERLRTSLNNAEARQTDRKNELLDELDAEFATTVIAIGIPGVETAKIHRTNYLPVLNGESFAKFSPPGGIRTATQVAYWISLLTIALRRRDTYYPAFLLIDSPRTALNNSDDLAAALYRRIVTQVDADRDRLQIIIGDNELPAVYRRDYDQLNFDYENPTISTIPHPGPAAVQTLNQNPPDEVE